MPCLQVLNRGILLASFLGFLLSYYTYVVEMNMEHDPKYVAMCDLSEHMSCTKAFNSVYGRGFGVIGKIVGHNSVFNQPNSVPGMIFYLYCGIISMSNSVFGAKVLLISSIVSNFMSLYLAYILYFILHDFCVVCVSTYCINFVLFILSYSKHKDIARLYANHEDKDKDS